MTMVKKKSHSICNIQIFTMEMIISLRYLVHSVHLESQANPRKEANDPLLEETFNTVSILMLPKP